MLTESCTLLYWYFLFCSVLVWSILWQFQCPSILALMFANATTMFGNRKITTKNRDSVLACLRASRAHLN